MDSNDKITLAWLAALAFLIPIVKMTYSASKNATNPITRHTMVPIVVGVYLLAVYALTTSNNP